MSAAPQLPYGEAQRRAAADWFVIIRAEDAPEATTLQAWLRWMESCDANRLAFEAIAQAWHAIPSAVLAATPDDHELAADGYDGESTIEAWRTQQRRGGEAAAQAATARITRRLPRALAAALIVCALVAVLLFAWSQSQRDARVPGEWLTRTGEQLDITLADGSRVWLGARSTLLVRFDSRIRTVQLRSGEAYFSVRKDRRPFRVQSPAGTITAVGTAFDVRTVADRVTVAVTEGVVSVSPPIGVHDASPAAVRVASGQQVTLQAHRPVTGHEVIASARPGERALWRDGVLVYRDEPLRDVVADVARYSRRSIEIADAAGALHFSGVVYRDAIEEWVAALPESFPVALESHGERLIIRAR
ncbi:MAG: FecR domain-containing protein [Gammaproteobacteria bacterium]|nr:FecR domain-containing protein [Gammaproteobacteria bacterium]